jgi:hypothetical protein
MPEMPNLGHIDRALTNISVAYMQADNAFIADKVFPIVRVTKQSDVYFSYSKADFFRNEVKERGRGVESAGGTWNLKEEPPYHCRKYAYHYDITQEERVNYDSPINVERDTTEWLAQKMLLRREIDFAEKFYKTGVWGRDVTADGVHIRKWDDPQSDPVAMVNNEMLRMAENTGKKPNFIIMAPDVFYALKNHDAIIDRIKYTQKGVVTLDLIAGLFEVDKIYIPWGIYNNGPKMPSEDTETGTDMKFIYKGSMLLGYRASRPSLKEATAGYIFAWTGLEGASAYGSRLVRIKMDMLGLGTERLEMEMAYDQKIICRDMGVFFTDLVTPAAD